jgi:hypothetical protein
MGWSLTNFTLHSLQEIYLEPVPLQEPAVNGVPLSLGFTPYAENLNGQLALLGLGALLSVELYSGGSFVNFHEGTFLDFVS